MAEKLYSERVQSTYVPNTMTIQSRYDIKDRLKLDKQNTVVIRSMKSVDLIPNRTDGDSIYIVPNKERHRPDIIAFNFYGTPLLYWVVLAANNLKSPFEVKEGLHLRLPSTEALYGNDGVMVK